MKLLITILISLLVSISLNTGLRTQTSTSIVPQLKVGGLFKAKNLNLKPVSFEDLDEIKKEGDKEIAKRERQNKEDEGDMLYKKWNGWEKQGEDIVLCRDRY